MIRKISNKEITDCIMFFNMKPVAFSDDYIKGYFCNGVSFKNFNMYQSMLSENMIVYGEFNESQELNDIIIYEYVKGTGFTYMVLDIFNCKNINLIKTSIKQIFEQYDHIEKIKLEIDRETLTQDVKDLLNTIDFKEELCIRKFNHIKNDIYGYAFFRR